MSRQADGMTLIEVLIALAIIGISLTAVIKAASQNIRANTYLKSKTIALWVAQEVMSEAQLGILKLPPERDGESKTTTMLGDEWFWRANEEPTGNPRIRKLNVRVYAREPEDADAAPLVALEGYSYHAN